MDAHFAIDVFYILDCFAQIGFTIYLACLQSLYILGIIPVLAIILIVYTWFYVRSYRELTRIDAVLSYPVVSFFSEAL